MLIALIRLLIANIDLLIKGSENINCLVCKIWEQSRMTKSAKTDIRLKAVITFDHVERSPLIKSIKSLIAFFLN